MSIVPNQISNLIRLYVLVPQLRIIFRMQMVLTALRYVKNDQAD